jgi:hypothetical protein
MMAMPLHSPSIRGLVPVLAFLALAACAGPGDFARPGTWQPSGANDANLRAMLADPGHAMRGVAAPAERGQPASLAIRRLVQDRRRPLPDSRASTIGAIADPGGAGPGPEMGNAH